MLCILLILTFYQSSPSPRRAWIEIVCVVSGEIRKDVALPRRAWIEIAVMNRTSRMGQTSSPSPRRAWIEIYLDERPEFWADVALPTEGVD